MHLQQKLAHIYTTITFDAVLLKSNPLHSPRGQRYQQGHRSRSFNRSGNYLRRHRNISPVRNERHC